MAYKTGTRGKFKPGDRFVVDSLRVQVMNRLGDATGTIESMGSDGCVHVILDDPRPGNPVMKIHAGHLRLLAQEYNK